MAVLRPARSRPNQAWLRRLKARQKSWLREVRRVRMGSPVEPEVWVSRMGSWPLGTAAQ